MFVNKSEGIIGNIVDKWENASGELIKKTVTCFLSLIYLELLQKVYDDTQKWLICLSV